MMKRNIFMIIGLMLFLQLIMAENVMLPLRLDISLVDDMLSTETNVPLRVTFKNISEVQVKILDKFEEKYFYMWFIVQIKDENETPLLNLPGSGKISIRGVKEYIELNPSEEYSFDINIADILSDINPGEYRLCLTYKNQYGDDCFKGMLDSNEIALCVQ